MTKILSCCSNKQTNKHIAISWLQSQYSTVIVISAVVVAALLHCPLFLCLTENSVLCWKLWVWVNALPTLNTGNCFQQQGIVHEQHVHNSSKLQSVQYLVSCNIVSRMQMEQSVTYRRIMTLLVSIFCFVLKGYSAANSQSNESMNM